MGRAKIADEVGAAAVEAALAGPVERNTTATAVRFLLQQLADTAPGNTLEVRIPPFGAVQCVEGPIHTRGTPPNVVETDAATWLRLASGSLSWADARSAGLVSASGQRADLTGHLPISWRTGRSAR